MHFIALNHVTCSCKKNYRISRIESQDTYRSLCVLQDLFKYHIRLVML